MIGYEDFLPIYPDISEHDFQQKIFEKKEFNELALSKNLEEIEKGSFLQHQKIIQRLLSSETLYDELLLYHETGTGKSGAAFAVTENLYNSKSFSKVYVFARGGDLLISLMKQLVYKYSKRYIIPENVSEQDIIAAVGDTSLQAAIDTELVMSNLRPDEQKKNSYIRKMVSDFYQFRTLETFSKELEKFSDDIIKTKYSNSVFIIDEVQNIKPDENAKIYKQFHRLFHLVENRKILLMSATPMRNEPNELAFILNLILPLKEQLPVNEEFNSKFILGDKIINKEILKDYIKGRISVLTSSPSNVDVRYMGNFLRGTTISQFKLFQTEMKDIQKNGYSRAYLRDTKEEKTIYSNSRQASLFVFPDESYGKEGLEKYTSKNGRFLPEFVSEVNTIQKLERLSSKYARVINDILSNPKKLVYIYCSIIHGSGIDVLVRLLEIYGFSRARGAERIEAKRFISLTSETSNIDKLINYFNSPDNRYGKYCQVIIGSRKISEGFTFKNIQIIHNITLHWNYTETQQANARGIRYLSHEDLENDGVIPIVEIYQHSSEPKLNSKNIYSIDMLMMDTSYKKDILVRKMNRVIKEIAIDCPLTHKRNMRTEFGDGSRECDYQACEYECDNVDMNEIKIDYSTFNLFYQKDDKIIEKIKKLYSDRFILKFQTIRDMLDLNEGHLIRVLSTMIRYNIPIINKYGIECFLREQDNEYYIVDSIVLPNNHKELSLYTEYPFMNIRKSMNKIVKENSHHHIMSKINEISESKTMEQIRPLVLSLPNEYQKKFLETSLVNIYYKKTSSIFSQIIEEIYKDKIKKEAGRIFSYISQPIVRCLHLDSGRWGNYTQEVKKENEVSIDIERNPYGFYGIIEGDKFCIKDIRDAIDNKEGKIDKRKIKTGANCLEVGFNKNKLAEICLHLGIEIPSDKLHLDPKRDLERTRNGKKLLQEWSSWSNEELARGYYWYSMDKGTICDSIKKWFAEKGLLVDGVCGKAGKRKDE